MSYLQNYLKKTPLEKQKSGAIAFLASLDNIKDSFADIANDIVQELKDQRSHLKLIASENYSSLAVQQAMGNLLTDKYSEGYVGHRFYAGCENVDAIEFLANDLAKKLFKAEHAYVQPHSGSDANMVAFWSILIKQIQDKEVEKLQKKTVMELTPKEYEKIRLIMMKQKIMGMSLNSGGHLSHGFRSNISAKMMQAVNYEVDPKTNLIDYAALQKQVKKEKPLILLAGYSAYSRLIDFSIMKEIADSVKAVLMVDMAHFAGLVAGKVLQGNFDPLPFADIVTSTTHKTLRGPRGGLILCKNEFKEVIDKGCPLVLGGPIPNAMAAKAIAFKEALSPNFATYAHQIVKNSQRLAKRLMDQNVKVLTNGTDNHLIVIDVASSFNLNGRQAEKALRLAKLTVNRNSIPQDINGPWYTSGVRLGTPATTTLGMKEEEMDKIGDFIVEILKNTKPGIDPKTNQKSKTEIEVDKKVLDRVSLQVKELLSHFPLYPELIVD
ncbi:MAG: glycine hydroxymethyltransferase [Chlamydiae bacterium]|nr:glycine hydroxymethyltransferase [Chlamydiota bacterium]